MALSDKINWEVRTGGSDSNGGGFKAGASGTDYSQQDSAQLSNTDLAIDATFNTKVSSAGSPFSSTSVGNLIQVTAGTGFTPGFYEVTAVVAGLATLDRAVGTTGSTGGTFALGGGLLTIAKAFAAITANNVSGNIVWVKSGTYTLTSTTTLPTVESFTLHGYQTTHGDATGTRPLITSATNSVHLLTGLASFVSAQSVINNISFSHTASTRGAGIIAPSNAPARGTIIVNCVFDGCSYGILGEYSGDYYFAWLVVVSTEIKNSVNDAILQSGNTFLLGCHLHNNGRDGVRMANGPNQQHMVIADSTVFANNTGDGIRNANQVQGQAGIVAKNSVFYTNAKGINEVTANQSGNSAIFNCIFEGNTTALSGDSSGVAFRLNNAFYNNTANLSSPSASFPFITDSSDITLSGSPFTNAGSGDFSLNNTAGAGAACRAAGFPGIIPNAGTGYLDIGALQHQDAGGGGVRGLMYRPSMGGWG